MTLHDDLSVADTLEAAADYLQTFGWRQLRMGDYGEPRCALGALDSVNDFETDSATFHFRQWLRRPSISNWNDDGRRTAEEVINTLREAAADWRLTNQMDVD